MILLSVIFTFLTLGGMMPFTYLSEKMPDEQIITFFDNLHSVQQEKLYLHIDKPYYAAGEQIWFKGYLLNSTTHKPDMPDRFIYIELISRDKKIVSRQKVKKGEDGFLGNFILPQDLVAGEYTLRGYTNWMRNAGPNFFYQRNIPVVNPFETSGKSVSDKEESIKESDFSVSFFPEGGHLLAGHRQQVAFKCQQSNGYSGLLKGCIVNQTGDTLVRIESEHDGMGSFIFLPEKNRSYYAVVKSPGYKEKKIELPRAEDTGITLTLNQSAGKIRYQILSSESGSIVSDSLYLFAHIRGELRFLLPVTAENNSGVIDLSFFPEGISHFLLMDNQGNKLSERLIFVYPEQKYTWHLQTDRNKYERREKVIMDIKLDGAELPVDGLFSMSISDNQSVFQDSLTDNIYSNLLLVSDLKGYIENPGWYFAEKSRKTQRGLDLLMLTHGWSRFDIKPFADQVVTPSYFVEKGQYISGRVLNFFGKEAKEAGIVAINPANNVVRTLESDEKGVFLVDGLDYCDSTTFVIQARNKKGLAIVDIEMDEETVPEIKSKILFPDSTFIVNQDYLLSAAEAGMRVIHLDDVVIQGKRSQSAKEEAERVWADYSMTEEMLGKSLARTAKDLFRHAMGGKDIDGADPLVVIDGMCCWDDNYMLETIFPDDIKSFDVYKDQKRCKYGSFSKSSPAVVITLKPEAMSRKRKGIALFRSLGYVKPDTFYQPTYETPVDKKSEKMDIRSTIYWNPVLAVDSTGCAGVEFYTSDLPYSYHVVIEGIGFDGQIYRYSGNVLK